ncbi:protein-arginine omega-N asymmetric methyltransferase [Aureococcus anophagefferens]|nr:protein-arginine omega-N asymmetric methyltransferase [Aureococcus anophagefferens]
MKGLCDEAVKRRALKLLARGARARSAAASAGAPLYEAYIADRLDLDDPLKGLVVRQRDKGWLQGFITHTTFTAWARTAWDSQHHDDGIVDALRIAARLRNRVGAGGARCKSLSKRTVAPSTADYVADQLGRDNYANSVQLGMLEDEARMDAYRVAIASEPKIKGGVVLDAGAAASSPSAVRHGGEARDVAAANGVGDVVEVVEDDVKNLDGSFDVIISEWMGSFLLGESMLPSVLGARDRLLKPGGRMMPCRATMRFAPARLDLARDRRLRRHLERLADWRAMERESTDVDFDVFTIDLENSGGGAEGFGDASLFEGVNPATISAFLGYFDVDFACGARLSTAPGAPDTHWGQTAFYCADLAPSSSTAGRLSFAQKPGEYFLASVELDEADGVDVDVEELEVELDDDDDDDDGAGLRRRRRRGR